MPQTQILARLMTDSEEFRESLRQDQKGWVGTRNYRVNTQDATLALFADNLPVIGDLWSGKLPTCTVKVRGPSVRIGGPDIGDGSGGWSRVQIEYRTPEASRFSQLPANVNDQWTELSCGRTQLLNLKPVLRTSSASPFPLCAPNNGDGAPVDFATIEARVYTFKPLTAAIDIARLLTLQRPSKLNDDEIFLPALYGAGARLRLEKGQARYAGWEPSVVGDFLQLVHVLELSENFDVRWYIKNSKGNPTDELVIDQMMDFASFAQLWR